MLYTKQPTDPPDTLTVTTISFTETALESTCSIANGGKQQRLLIRQPTKRIKTMHALSQQDAAAFLWVIAPGMRGGPGRMHTDIDQHRSRTAFQQLLGLSLDGGIAPTESDTNLTARLLVGIDDGTTLLRRDGHRFFNQHKFRMPAMYTGHNKESDLMVRR